MSTKKEIKRRKEFALQADPSKLQELNDQSKLEVLYYQKEDPEVSKWIIKEVNKRKSKYMQFFTDQPRYEWDDLVHGVVERLYKEVFPNFIRSGKMKTGGMKRYLARTIQSTCINLFDKYDREFPEKSYEKDSVEIGDEGETRLWEENTIENLPLERKEIRNHPGLTEEERIYISLKMDKFSDVDTPQYFDDCSPEHIRTIKTNLQKNEEFELFLNARLSELKQIGEVDDTKDEEDKK
jgi:hypothetical protein